MKRPAIRFFTPVLVTVAIATVVWVNAGQLNPPAGSINPTGPTTLNQQDIGAGPLFSLNTSGSYILTSDIVAPGGYTGDGIAIGADNVTLNMNGFALIGAPGSGDGINMPTGRSNVVIRNGNIRDWDGSGINARINNGRIERISASRNGGWGIDNHSMLPQPAELDHANATFCLQGPESHRARYGLAVVVWRE